MTKGKWPDYYLPTMLTFGVTIGLLGYMTFSDMPVEAGSIVDWLRHAVR